LVARQGTNQLRYESHVCQLAGANAKAHRGRSLKRNTNLMAPCVSEKLAILLSTNPAASPASIRSVSRRGLPGPFRRTTQIAPLGSIHSLACRSRSRSALSSAPKITMSHTRRGFPSATSRVRPRSCFTKEASSMSITATREPGLTPSLSRSGFVVSATDRSEDDHTEQPATVRARYREDDRRHRTCNTARQQAAKPHQQSEDQGAGDPARHGADQRRGGDLRSQTSITCRSLTAPVVVPEYTWLNRKRVSGCLLRSRAAFSQLIWLKTSPGPVASTIATSAPSTSLSSGAV